MTKALPEGPPLTEAMNLWLEGHAISSGLKDSSIGCYRTRINRVSRTSLASMKVSEIQLRDLKAWQVDSLARHSIRTVRDDLTVINGAVTWAIDHGYRDHNPAREITFPKEERKKRRALTPEESRVFLAHCKNEPLGAAASLLYINGLRISEVLGLAWQDIDLAEKTFRISRAYVDVRGS